MTDTKSAPEPAGAERFRAVPPVAPTKAVPPTPSDPMQALEARVADLEAVVHVLAPYNRNAEHPGVVAWLAKVGQRLLAIPLRKT